MFSNSQPKYSITCICIRGSNKGSVVWMNIEQFCLDFLQKIWLRTQVCTMCGASSIRFINRSANRYYIMMSEWIWKGRHFAKWLEKASLNIFDLSMTRAKLHWSYNSKGFNQDQHWGVLELEDIRGEFIQWGTFFVFPYTALGVATFSSPIESSCTLFSSNLLFWQIFLPTKLDRRQSTVGRKLLQGVVTPFFLS